ncbi:MAG: hypothetical protein AAGC55_11795, partial [Myxococcota bacterium]
PPSWPARQLFCVDCRVTLVTEREAEHHGTAGHLVVDLAVPAKRAALVERVWGGDPTDMKLAGVAPEKVMSSLGISSLVGAIVGAIHSSEMVVLVGAIALVLFALAAITLGAKRMTQYSVGYPTLPSGRQVRRKPLPAAKEPPLLLAGSSAIRGTVASGVSAPAPISAAPAVAFSVTLALSRSGERQILKDAATLGFAVVIDDGAFIDIPSGPIEVIAHGQRLSGWDDAVDDYLDALDPHRADSLHPDPFTHDHVIEAVVAIGDHVAVHNPLTRAGPAATVGERGGPAYREAPAQRFRVEGTPCVELLP